MNKKWIVINLARLAATGLLGWELRLAIDRFKVANDISKIQPVQSVKRQIPLEGGIPPLKPPRNYNAGEFAVIPGQNVFSESRTKEDKVEAAPVVPVVPELTNKPVLVGVTISGNQRLAAITDPTIATARKTQTKRVGDVYQGYTITDITTEQVILEAGNRREIIPLHDGSKRQAQGGKTTILASRVVSFGGGTGSGGTTPAPVIASGGAARPAAAQGAAQTVPGQAGRTTPQQGRQAAGPQTPAITPQTSAPAPPPAPVAPPGSRIIRTPFGDIVRPDNPNP